MEGNQRPAAWDPDYTAGYTLSWDQWGTGLVHQQANTSLVTTMASYPAMPETGPALLRELICALHPRALQPDSRT